MKKYCVGWESSCIHVEAKTVWGAVIDARKIFRLTGSEMSVPLHVSRILCRTGQVIDIRSWLRETN